MRLFILCITLLGSVLASAQMNSTRQKALNAYIEYGNQSAEEISRVVTSVLDYYPDLQNHNRISPRYVCPFQIDPYYAANVDKLKPSLLPAVTEPVDKSFKKLREAESKTDELCKALDTYHKLEDYKQDNFGKARTLIDALQISLTNYKKAQDEFHSTIRSVYNKISGSSPADAYRQADIKMQDVLTVEKKFIDSWMYNLNEETHTGWEVSKLQQSISETDRLVTALKKENLQLKYPASSMWSQFQSSLSSILEVKRRALDEYNFEAKKSDRHSNGVYLDLINYFNGTILSEYNTFIEFAERNGYYGLRSIRYVPSFEIRFQQQQVDVSVKQFTDIPVTSFEIIHAKNALTKTVFGSLTSYVDFINETWRQTRYMQSALWSFNASAAYFKTLSSYERRAPMHFDYSDYHLPRSHFQKTIAASDALPSTYSKSLNEQAEVLLNILKEMDDLGASLDIEVKERRYEKDHLAKVYNILERQAELLKIWDVKKERLYHDLRAIYNSFPPADKTNSWQISGSALRELADLDRDALFQAKAYYGGDSNISVTTTGIDAALREVIAREYENMKGIQKIGRNNGLCPYTPYEDLPVTSKQLSEHFKKLPPVKSLSRYNHPYYSMVYLYNEIVDDYNKFCELSTSVPHLKTLKQPELFSVKYPDTKSQTSAADPQTSRPLKQTAHIQESKESHENTSQHNATVIRDTIYIERRDTVYLHENTEDLRSMEGYATNNMILLLDASGSMNQPEKLPVLKQSMLQILSMMREEDKITIIAFSGKPKILLKPVSFREEEKIRKAVSNLSSSGKTDGNAALKLAYKVADDNYLRGGNNRIILATDGEFSISDETKKLIENFSNQDIFLTIFNFGKGAGSSRALQHLSTLGKGNYETISKENAELKLIREAKARRKK